MLKTFEDLLRGIIEEHSYFEEEYPVLEYSERSLVENWDEGENEHTPPPWKDIVVVKI